MKLELKLTRAIARNNMRNAAFEYRRALTWSLWDGDWNGRIKAALTWLDLAKTYRRMSHES